MKLSICLLAAAVGIIAWRGYGVAATTPAPNHSQHVLLIEANEGEQRYRRIPAKGAKAFSVAASSFFLKVDRQHGGSGGILLLMEHLKPGAVIPRHRHLRDDEIVYIEGGTVHAVVGDEEGDVHDGGTIFIPHNTWVTMKNDGNTTLNLLAFFNGADFAKYLRCASVGKGQPLTTMTTAQRRACAAVGKVQYQGL